jgi:hypothetical protein
MPKQQDRDVRMQIMLQPEKMATIEDWRFSKRMPSRASAVRELLRRGLAAEGFKLAAIGKHSFCGQSARRARLQKLRQNLLTGCLSREPVFGLTCLQ